MHAFLCELLCHARELVPALSLCPKTHLYTTSVCLMWSLMLCYPSRLKDAQISTLAAVSRFPHP